MSLNQINPNLVSFPGNKKWVNIRVDDMNILDQLNIDTSDADVGDELTVGVGGALTWIPSNIVSPIAIDSAVFRFTSIHINTVADVPLLLDPTPIVASPDIVIIGGTNVKINAIGRYMIFLNLVVNVTLTTNEVNVRMQRYNAAGNVWVNDLETLGVSSVYQSPPGGNQSMTAFGVIVVRNLSDINEIRIVGSLNSASSTVTPIQTQHSTLSLLKIS